jgi:hypothetical protein
MGLEAATYIEDLVGTNPTGSDDKNQGDNHLRLIKDVLQNQFPNLGDAAVTSSAAELNGSNMPTGMIMMWYGNSGNIPTGWILCDGTNSTPDLTSKFAYGGTTTGGTGGSNQIPTATTDGTTLTIAQIPSHRHRNDGMLILGAGTADLVGGGSSVTNDNFSDYEGGGGSHAHTMTHSSTSNMPAYTIVVYIMKV